MAAVAERPRLKKLLFNVMIQGDFVAVRVVMPLESTVADLVDAVMKQSTFSSLISPASAQTCNTYTFSNTHNTYRACKDLEAFNYHLRWNYNQDTNTLDLACQFADHEMIIYATIVLPKNMMTVNHVWQEGPIDGDSLGMHPVSGDNVRSMGTVDLLSGKVFTIGH
ncbi:hypothetical protein Patl1_02828 [Pistacia atlantica]|uniref:Uncharacterized protein n=1 Tax=Pistacia atlantica TaxID=434234 RepID=A0ACC1CB18_9ROSI|nr:hypothetical protein Patl1_02828 [Pistacia atlantica]